MLGLFNTPSMSERDVEKVWEYVDPHEIADELSWAARFSSFTEEELLIAGEAVSRHRIPKTIGYLASELAARDTRLTELLDQIETKDVIDLYDIGEDGEDDYWWRHSDALTEAILSTGNFVNFKDFMLAQRQVRTAELTVTNLFHTLVLFFLEDDPEKHREVERELRNNPYGRAWSNDYSPTRRFFIRSEELIPYASEKVEPEFKIKGIGRLGRRLMRAVLFDDEDINVIWLHERRRFDRS